MLSTSAVFLLAVAALGALAQQGPALPQEFAANITVHRDNEPATGQWFRSAKFSADRFDLEFADGATVVEINRYSDFKRYIIYKTRESKPICHVTQSGNQPSYNFSNYKYVGKYTWHRELVEEWSLGNRSTTQLIYLEDANTHKPVQYSEWQQNRMGFGIYFESIEEGPQNPAEFDVQALFPGLCNDSLVVREFNRQKGEILVTKKVTGNPSDAAEFANEQWNCADVSCSVRVPAGSAQPNYECAEFVARSLAKGGYIAGLDATSPQSAYGSHKSGGKTYDLLWVSSKQGGPLGLREFLLSIGWHPSNSISAASSLSVVGSDGAYSHAVVGVGSNLINAHNMARYHEPGSFYQIDEILNP